MNEKFKRSRPESEQEDESIKVISKEEVSELAHELSNARTLLVTLAKENARLSSLLDYYIEQDNSLISSSQLDPPNENDKDEDAESIALEAAVSIDSKAWPCPDTNPHKDRESITLETAVSIDSKAWHCPDTNPHEPPELLSQMSSISDSSIENKLFDSLADWLAFEENVQKKLQLFSDKSTSPTLPLELPENISRKKLRPSTNTLKRGHTWDGVSESKNSAALASISETSLKPNPNDLSIAPKDPATVCKHPASEVVRVGVGVIVSSSSHPGCILVGTRANSHGNGQLALPGGHLEVGESFEGCAKREVAEETGLEIDVHSDVAWIINSPDIDKRLHYVTIFMRGYQVDSSKEPELLEPDKCTGWRWIEWESLQQRQHTNLFHPLQSLLDSNYLFQNSESTL